MKDTFIVEGLSGTKSLEGRIKVGGAKNAVLKIMAGSLLFKDGVSLSNVPNIEDVKRMEELLMDLGVSLKKKGQRALEIRLEGRTLKSRLHTDISKKMRASILLTGPLLARLGEVSFPYPGGCVLGARPIDLFVEGFRKMGASVSFKNEAYHFRAPQKKLQGTTILFKTQSVTATETFMMAGILARGKTILKNCAMEPEVKNLADFLSARGAKIKGAGTPTIEVQGSNKLLRSGSKVYKTMPDRLEAGSFLILGALTAKNLEITNCNPADLEIVIEFLRNAGVPVETGKTSISIVDNKKDNKEFKGTNFKTHEYPGFPTDLQAPMTVFLTQATGESLVFETIFEGRLNYTEDIVKMGANITMWDPHRVMVKGPTLLKGRVLEGPDIRAGLAYVIAATVARGRSVIENVYYIDRGYESIEKRLQMIGVDIERVRG